MAGLTEEQIAQLGPVLRSIMGSQDREFDHQSSMQNRSLSAQQSMHRASLANALRIAEMNNSTQRYGIDTVAETTRRGQDLDQQARRWQNALNYLQIGASLRGPQDYFQYANFARGASQTDFPAFLADLMANGGIPGTGSANGSTLPSFGAVNGPTPAPASIQGLAEQLRTGQMGTPGTGSGDSNDLLGSIDEIARNMHRLSRGSLEALTGTERALLQSGAEARGHDWPTLLERYMAAGIGQGDARAA